MDNIRPLPNSQKQSTSPKTAQTQPTIISKLQNLSVLSWFVVSAIAVMVAIMVGVAWYQINSQAQLANSVVSPTPTPLQASASSDNQYAGWLRMSDSRYPSTEDNRYDFMYPPNFDINPERKGDGGCRPALIQQGNPSPNPSMCVQGPYYNNDTADSFATRSARTGNAQIIESTQIDGHKAVTVKYDANRYTVFIDSVKTPQDLANTSLPESGVLAVNFLDMQLHQRIINSFTFD